jgi:hypothetical protein
MNIYFYVLADKNLAGLKFQLQDKTVKQICDILLMSQSVYIREFLTLVEEIEVSICCAFIQ